MNRILVGLAVIVFSISAAWPEVSPTNDISQSPKPFVRAWRVVLRGKAAEGMNWATPGWQLDGGEISATEIDAIEQQLLPALAADLQDAGSPDLPRDYYRQYATGRWKKYHIVLIHGFHRGHLNEPFDSVAERDRWKREPIDLTDGGTHFWDAVYVVELRKFAKMKGTGHTSRTVVFHGVA